MAIKKRLSSGFSGGETRSLEDLDREIEYRLGHKKLDVFTNEFDPPMGAREDFPGADFDKRKSPYGKPHDDYSPENKNRVKVSNELHSAGDPRDQEKMDWLDDQQHKIQAPIKNPYDQFPGSYMEVSDMESDIGPEEFHKRVESKMKRMAADAPGDNEKKIADYKDCEIREYCEDAMGEVMKFRVYREGQKIADRIDSQSDAKAMVDKMLTKMSADQKKKLAEPASDNAGFDKHQTDPATLSETRKDFGHDEVSESDKRDEAMMKKHLAEVDEALWQKAKDASKEGLGKVKWPFVMWWYKEHGGK